ncbi:hypothetical protein ACFLY4_04355 [Chloroflexota bacterium]
MSDTDWKHLTNTELKVAEDARQAGNEGRARVCARRAAGHIVGEYLRRAGITFKSESALDRLRYLETYSNTPALTKVTVEHFLVHITPEHKLPIDADLIADVELLARDLLDEELV